VNPGAAVAASNGSAASIKDSIMLGSPALFTSRTPAPLRRLILCAAVVLAVAVWSVSKTPSANAQDTKPPASPALPALPPLPALPAAPADPAKPAPAGERSHTFEISIGDKTDSAAAKAAPDGSEASAAAKDAGPAARTVTVKKGSKTVTVTGIPGDREFDSFGEMAHMEPALATMIVAIVAVVFFAPVVAIALILGYRMRKTRMQNETMLKLAERGIVTPADAIGAVATGTMGAPLRPDFPAQPGAGPLTPADRVNELRKRASWSDLRKGIVMGAIGLGLTLFSVLDDRSPNSLGLVLLFVGIGYGVLWWFEERQIGPRSGGAESRPGAGPGSAS
jgi:hypothetical protein